MHYQFETIHSFLDGNGRSGRLLIGLLLHQQCRLTTPLLYLSGYLETHRREYCERLQALRERGEIHQWLQFFLTAVQRQAEDGVDRAGQLVRVRQEYVSAAGPSPASPNSKPQSSSGPATGTKTPSHSSGRPQLPTSSRKSSEVAPR